MKNILEYQKLDGEIAQIDRKLESSKEHEVISKMANVYKVLQTKLMTIETDAEKLNNEYESTIKTYKKTLSSIEELTAKNAEKLEENELNTSLDLANKLSSELFMLERKLNQILTDINAMLKEFEVTKKNALTAKNKHAEAKQNLDNLKDANEPAKKEIETKLKALESKQNPEILAKYKSLKNDNLFPVFVPLNDKNCGYCRVELPSHKVDRLKNEDYILCEQCGRLIYQK